MRKGSGLDNFWNKVVKTDDCWLWTGNTNHAGYGLLRTGMANYVRAHRVAWEFEHGSIPEGMHVLHKCDVRNCVRHSHLFLGTNADNVADKVSKDRQIKGEQHPAAKLTEAMVQMIKMMLARGKFSQRRIADIFGVHVTTINPIATGRTWRHVL